MEKGRLKSFQTTLQFYSGLNLNQDKATKPQTVQIVRQGEATPYWFKFNPLYLIKIIPKTNTYRRCQYKKQTQGCRYEKVLGKLQKEFTITG